MLQASVSLQSNLLLCWNGFCDVNVRADCCLYMNWNKMIIKMLGKALHLIIFSSECILQETNITVRFDIIAAHVAYK